MKKYPRVGDYIRITNPWGNNWKSMGITEEERKVVTGMICKIIHIKSKEDASSGFSDLCMRYCVKVISSKDRIKQIMPNFAGETWDRCEFEIIKDKLEVFSEVI